MIARLFPCTRLGVNHDFPDAFGKVGGGKNMVDAKAMILFKACLAIIPPTLGFRSVQTQRPGIDQTSLDESLKGFALGG